MSRFDAVIFDMDGVLIDSEPLHFEVLNAILRRDGHELTTAENEEFIGATSQATFGMLIQRWGLKRTVDDYIALYDEELLKVLATPRPPAPGVLALLQQIRTRAKHVAVASSSRRLWIDATLRSLGLSDAFDAIVSGDDVTHGKPDPEIYLLAATHLGVPPEHCLAIEDSPNGVQSAHRAGMAVIGVRTPYTAHLHLDGAIKVVDSLTEVDFDRDL